MSNPKLIVLLLISFIATGSVVYQIRIGLPNPPIVPSRPSGPPILPAGVPPDVAQTAVQPGSETATPVSSDIQTNIPPDGWGRNPFLTREEINKANQPPVTEIVQTPEMPVTASPAAPPTYAVTAIIYGPNGSFAVVNSRVVQAGDRVGYEIVKEIKSRAVVLEYDGRTRELPLRRLGPDIQLNIPKGD